mmetsp:Transcript_4614/g.14820  ORF Transcript_4614/g.14820 Transcript_4614/m.14820 type:complete len:272 (-) Transcript_4614:145-960(-)
MGPMVGASWSRKTGRCSPSNASVSCPSSTPRGPSCSRCRSSRRSSCWSPSRSRCHARSPSCSRCRSSCRSPCWSPSRSRCHARSPSCSRCRSSCCCAPYRCLHRPPGRHPRRPTRRTRPHLHHTLCTSSRHDKGSPSSTSSRGSMCCTWKHRCCCLWNRSNSSRLVAHPCHCLHRPPGRCPRCPTRHTKPHRRCTPCTFPSCDSTLLSLTLSLRSKSCTWTHRWLCLWKRSSSNRPRSYSPSPGHRRCCPWSFVLSPGPRRRAMPRALHAW